MRKILALISLMLIPGLACASQGAELTHSLLGMLGIVIFIAAYILVPLENIIHLRKSKPVLLAAGIIWILVSLAYSGLGDTHTAHAAIQHSLLEYAELLLFLLAAMTYINAMEERNVFEALRAFLVSRGFSLRKIFWITGLLSFCISPVADNLTTALLMGAVVMAVGGSNTKFVVLACINIVVAANAGGAFSPFGDITTLMVWQKGKLQFFEFFQIFIPAAINWLVPAVAMSFAVPRATPEAMEEEVQMKYGAVAIVLLFLLTIITAVSFHNLLHLPPAAGMMLGLGYLGFCSYYIKMREGRHDLYDLMLGSIGTELRNPLSSMVAGEAPLSKTIAGATQAAFAIDRNHLVTHWNRAMQSLSGIPAEEAIGKPFKWDVISEKGRPSLAEMVLEDLPKHDVKSYYNDHCQRDPQIDKGYDAVDYFPSLGQKGRWLSFAAAPLTDKDGNIKGAVEVIERVSQKQRKAKNFDIMRSIAQAEWDTLLFFYGVIMCVGGLAQFGYLALLSESMYTGLGATYANILVGVLSAIVDNIPVMFAVLTMDPVMDKGQWLLVTLTAGVGGSLLSIGSAAGVALMGTARGKYTFGAHLKWTPVIALGYAASILALVLMQGL